MRTPRSKGGGGWGLESQVPKGAWMLGLSSARHPLPPPLTLACLAAQTTSPSSAAPSHLARLTLDPSKPCSPFSAPPPPLQPDVNPSAARCTSKARLSLHLPRGRRRASCPQSPPAPNLATSAHLSFQWNPGGVPRPLLLWIPESRPPAPISKDSGAWTPNPLLLFQEPSHPDPRLPSPSGTPESGPRARPPPLLQTHGSAAPASEGRVSRAPRPPAALHPPPASAARRPLPCLPVSAILLPPPDSPRRRGPATRPGPRGPAPSPGGPRPGPSRRPAQRGLASPCPAAGPGPGEKIPSSPGGGAGGGGRGREAGRGA